MKSHLCGVLVVLAMWSGSYEAEAFCGNRTLEVELVRLAVQSGEWLKLQQDKSGGFGYGHESGQAFLSLKLLGFALDDSATTHLKSEIHKHNIYFIPIARLAHYIHGVLSTCGNPSKFHKHNLDLVRHVKKGLAHFPIVESSMFETHFEYSVAVLALCNSGHVVKERFAKVLTKKLKSLKRKGKAEVKNPFSPDTAAMATTALSCVYKNQAKSMNREYRKKLQLAIKLGVHLLLEQQNDDGSFGNEVTTALVVQAILAADHKVKKWSCGKTMRYIINKKDHWFRKNVMSTVQIMPALVGAVPFDINTIECPAKGPKPQVQNIDACVKLVVDESNMIRGKVLPPPAMMVVANGTSAHDLLKKAAKIHPCYKFSAVKSSYGHMITEICGVPNNNEKKYYWMVYSTNTTMAAHGVDHFYSYPKDGSCVIFKYQKLTE